MTGAERSFVTVGFSLTVANGFPPLQQKQRKTSVRYKVKIEDKAKPMRFCWLGCITHPKKGGFAVPLANDTCQQDKKDY